MESVPAASHEAAPQARSRSSLRLQLSVWIVAIFAVIQLTLGLIVLIYERASLDAFFNERHAARALPYVEAVGKSQGPVSSAELERVYASRLLRSKFFEPMQIGVFRAGSERAFAEANGASPSMSEIRAVLGARSIPAHRRSSARSMRMDIERGHGGVRLGLYPATSPEGEVFLVFVRSTDDQAEAMYGFVTKLLLVLLPTGLIAAGIAGWVISGMAVRPLRQLRGLANVLDVENISRPVQLPRASSELQEVQKNLEDARARLQKALEAQDRFISNVSHELKTPVAVLLIEAQTLGRDGLNPDQKRFIESVTDEMRRLGRLVESFLTLTRVRAGKGVPHAAICSVNEIVMASVEACMPMSQQYEVRINPHLYDGEPDLTLIGDRELLRAMLDNLIRNAIRFSPENAQVFVTVSNRGDGWCELRVRDQGPGIPQEISGTLFDRFTQAPSEGPRGRGYGLGLSIAQGIAELHGGAISQQNVAPHGCEFTISLPLVSTRPTEAAPSARDAAPAALGSRP